uniref:Secreted mucin n=1 Tax=Poecilia formosa TaxID=48698 RepID=A0A087XPC9_POEFO
NMVTAQVFLRVSLFALLLVAVHGSPIKGSKSQSQGRPSDSSGDDDGSHQGSATGYSAPVFYSTYGGVSKPAGTRANLPEMELVIAPQAFEEATTNTQPRGLSIVGPPLPPTPSTPTLQSGEMSNVVKEAEFGNYQQQTEAFGYPSDHVGPGLPPVALLASGVGGLLSFPSPYCLPYPFPYPYPDFDYRLLYGQYPPGTYTTFSKNHEKGKEYQTIHYLKEHGSD